jgi:hypothetical protein
MDTVAAKQFLISRVIAEAELERVPLSDVETKMLHFTEVHPSLPDIYDVYMPSLNVTTTATSMRRKSRSFEKRSR